jgi:LmbE family N-acetylglucosaminyl deacetylase
MKVNFERILAVGAHLDDIELGCGGFISKSKSTCQIYILVLSSERRNSKGQIQEKRKVEEAISAIKKLGINKNNFYLENIPSQLFDSHEQEIREILIKYNRKINPDLILCPSKNDVHQDHRILCEQVNKVFKRKTQLGYEIINSSFSFLPQLYIGLSKKDVARKVLAVGCYKSQMDKKITTGDYFSKKVVEGLAISRGAKIGVSFAEAFEIYHFEII